MRIYVKNLTKDLSLTKENAAHLAALRIKAGEVVTLFDGSGLDYVCKVAFRDRRDIRLELIDTVTNDKECRSNVTLYMAAISQDKFSLVVQKATELGVKRIIPVISAYAQNGFIYKAERMNVIASAACEQCGRSILPTVEPPLKFSEVLKDLSDYDDFIFAYEKANEGSVKAALSLNAHNVALFVGPEGGISSDEAASLLSAGAKAVTFGKRILRAETAAIAGLTLINDALGELC